MPDSGNMVRNHLWNSLLFITFFFIFAIINANPCSAADGRNCSSLTKEKIESILSKLNAASTEILNVGQTPINGLCEIVVRDQTGLHVFYSDHQLDYLLFGNLVETKSMTSLSAKTSQKIQDQRRIDLSKISLADALILGDSKASKKVIIFTDPDCSFCVKLHQVMVSIVAKRKDIAFYIKLFPLSMHKDAYWKAKSIVCKKSLSLLEDCYAGRIIEKTDCNTKEVDKTIELARSLSINGTPAVIFPDGRFRIGIILEKDLINMIDGKI